MRADNDRSQAKGKQACSLNSSHLGILRSVIIGGRQKRCALHSAATRKDQSYRIIADRSEGAPELMQVVDGILNSNSTMHFGTTPCAIASNHEHEKSETGPSGGSILVGRDS